MENRTSGATAVTYGSVLWGCIVHLLGFMRAEDPTAGGLWRENADGEHGDVGAAIVKQPYRFILLRCS